MSRAVDDPAPGPAVDGAGASRTSPARRRLVVAALVGVAPVVVLAIVAPTTVMPWFLGMLPALVAGIASLRRAAVVATLTGTLALVAPLAGSQVWSATVLMSVVAAGLGLAAGRGWSSGGAPAAATLAALTVAPPALTTADPRTLEGALPIAALVLAGGLWTVATATVLTRSVERRPRAPMSGPETAWYTAALVGFTAVGTWWAMTYFPGTHSWWLLLTFYMVMVPRTADITARALARAAGTVLGGLVIVTLVALDASGGVLTVAVVAGAVGGVVAYLVAPYWVYTAFLTLTVVGLSAGGAPVAGAEARVGLTLVGAGSAAGILLLVRAVGSRARRTGDGSPG
ncbi:fusaric acid resistance family protein [Isoptericola sp. CG 20/1183]|uniref:Fusaric acid resistance family protein n=1 Tax=Isoptericola halotolerans TaxID=300560 RepID=A0ABX5EK10_9MICO|nr:MULTISPECIES: FUSC family protein [Isoptericola]PRZ04185.1 fusaric acid resistance family protein [Isoptericola sp. CG 20/1183]PRZ09990.1 fusaric acid resistance family protein [Isoptericola halotolerans]